MKRTNKRKPRGFLGGFLSVFGTVVVLLLVALAVAVVVVPKVNDGAALTVLTGSMEPTISPGDMIVVEGVKYPDQEIMIGDVVTFMPNPQDPTLVTHRVIGKAISPENNEVSFVTQGDANSAVDDPIAATQIRGKLMYTIPYLGWVTNWLTRHMAIALTGVGLLVAAYFFWGSGPLKRRTHPSEPAPAANAEAKPQANVQASAQAAPPAWPDNNQTTPSAAVNHSPPLVQNQPSAGVPSRIPPAVAADRPAAAPVVSGPSAGRATPPQDGSRPAHPQAPAPNAAQPASFGSVTWRG